MRWVFLFLIVLNVFYYVWQQQAPLRPRGEASLNLRQAEQNNIRLLSESPEAPQRRQEVSPATPEVPSGSCSYLGSFSTEEGARQLAQRLLSLDLQASVQSVDASAGLDYWVYLPALASRQASLRQLRELQARRIDSFIITEGDLKDAISLGIFPNRESAEKVVERIKTAGYDALIRDLNRAQQDYWVQISRDSGHLLDDPMLLQLSTDFPDLQKQTMPCRGIARHP